MLRESVAEAALHLLWAIDGGYYLDDFLKDSAYVTALRVAVQAETGKSGYPRLVDAPAPVSPTVRPSGLDTYTTCDAAPAALRPAAIFDALTSMNAARQSAAE